MNKNPLKCEICGKFISYKDFEQNKVKTEFTFDTEFTSESYEFYHIECLKKPKKL